MQSKPIILKNFSVELTQNQILKRLGYNKHKSVIDNNIIKEIEDTIKKIKILAKCSGTFKLTDIKINNNTILFFEANSSITNINLKNNLEKNQGNSYIMMAVTIGNDVIEQIADYNNNNETTKAVILDAAASELAENTINYIEEKALLFYKKYGKKSNYRFSPGYKGVELIHQQLFEKILHISKIDVFINKYYILNPEKSITAFLPFKKNITTDFTY